MLDLPPETEAQLASLSDAEWSALSARVRAPDSTEALRTAAAQVLSEDAANSFVAFADVSKFVGDDGKIDEAKVRNHISRAYGLPLPNSQPPNWGQHSSGNTDAPRLRPGDRARAEAVRRFGGQLDPATAAATAGVSYGQNGKAEAARRFPAAKDTQ